MWYPSFSVLTNQTWVFKIPILLGRIWKWQVVTPHGHNKSVCTSRFLRKTSFSWCNSYTERRKTNRVLLECTGPVTCWNNWRQWCHVVRLFSHRGRAQTPAWRVPSVSVRAHRTARNALQPREQWRPTPWWKEGKTYEEAPYVCAKTPDDDEEVLGVTRTGKHQLIWAFSVLLTEDSTSCFLENAGGIIFAQMAHSVSRCQSWDHALLTPWRFGGKSTNAVLGFFLGARQMRPNCVWGFRSVSL